MVEDGGVGEGLGIAFHLLAATALGHDGLMEAAAEGFGELVNLVVAVDFDGLFGGIHDHVAFVAPMKVFVQFGTKAFADIAVKIVGQFVEKLRALHRWPSPFFLDLKYFARRSRNCNLARNNLDLTAGTLSPSISAVSSVERPSTSRNTNTVRKPGGNP